MGTALALALAAYQGDLTGHRWADTLICISALITLVPAATRISATVLALVMAFLGVHGLVIGQSALQQPVRALMFTVIYVAMAFDSLLILRLGTGLSLFLFFGTTKIGWVIAGNTASFAQLIGNVGFPFPTALAALAILNETVTPLLVALGVWIRPAAIVGALGMTGAFYTSLRLGEDAVRAATYVVAFTAIALLVGPNRRDRIDEHGATRGNERRDEARES